ncbi:Uncharacterised protein [Mycolicibacterium phlei]|nr:Uncharacterised protein [Mycolicibacterium phlei]
MTKTNGALLSPHNVNLLPEDQIWLDAQRFSHVPTHNRRAAVAFLNDVLGIPYKNGAVFRAFDDREIPTALVSGAALASPHDIAKWALAKKYRHLTQAG